MRRQRRRVRRAQHAMAARVDDLALGLCVGAPQQEHQVLALRGQGLDDVVGEAFPALALVRAGAALLHRQHADQVASPFPHQLGVAWRCRTLDVGGLPDAASAARFPGQQILRQEQEEIHCRGSTAQATHTATAGNSRAAHARSGIPRHG